MRNLNMPFDSSVICVEVSEEDDTARKGLHNAIQVGSESMILCLLTESFRVHVWSRFCMLIFLPLRFHASGHGSYATRDIAMSHVLVLCGFLHDGQTLLRSAVCSVFEGVRCLRITRRHTFTFLI